MSRLEELCRTYTELTPEDGEKVIAARALTLSDGPASQEIIAEITDADGETTRLVLALRSGKEGLE